MASGTPSKKEVDKLIKSEIERLQHELVKLQYWVKEKGMKVLIIFEGRDGAGKGSIIKTLMEPLNHRTARVVALGKPTAEEKTQWYFQRYVKHLPAAGEIVLYDRSWYNRAGVEKVMGFATDEEVEEFYRTCPEFENQLIRSGIILLKYWLEVTPEYELSRFVVRNEDPFKRWKLSEMDKYSQTRWQEYTYARDEMFLRTDTETAPWWKVRVNTKVEAQLNCITHILGQINYGDVVPPAIDLPEKSNADPNYVPPEQSTRGFIPEYY